MIEFDVQTLTSGVGVIAPRGRLNRVGAGGFTDQVGALVGAGTHRIVVDLAEVAFLDSSGLGALIGAVKTTRKSGGDLRIARPTDEVLSILELTNITRILRPRESVEGAFDD